jgi:hypothetical protein
MSVSPASAPENSVETLYHMQGFVVIKKHFVGLKIAFLSLDAVFLSRIMRYSRIMGD